MCTDDGWMDGLTNKECGKKICDDIFFFILQPTFTKVSEMIMGNY